MDTNKEIKKSPDQLSAEEQAIQDRKKEYRKKVILKTVFWVLLVAVLAFLMLFLSSKIGQFNSIRDMFLFIERWLSADNFR